MAAVIFVAGTGTTFAVPDSFIKASTSSQAVATLVADSECQAVFAAGDKLFETPYHMYMIENSPSLGKPMSSEGVSFGGVQYILVNGKWSTSPLSIAEVKRMELENRKTAKNTSCHYVHDEAVGGENAAVYSTHSETEHGKNDNQIWVSKSRGLIVKQETDIDIGNGRPRTHVSVRYDYSNVQKPPL